MYRLDFASRSCDGYGERYIGTDEPLVIIDKDTYEVSRTTAYDLTEKYDKDLNELVEDVVESKDYRPFLKEEPESIRYKAPTVMEKNGLGVVYFSKTKLGFWYNDKSCIIEDGDVLSTTDEDYLDLSIDFINPFIVNGVGGFQIGCYEDNGLQGWNVFYDEGLKSWCITLHTSSKDLFDIDSYGCFEVPTRDFNTFESFKRNILFD